MFEGLLINSHFFPNSMGLWEDHYQVEKHKNKQHYLQEPYWLSFDLLLEDLLHACLMVPQNNVLCKADVELMF